MTSPLRWTPCTLCLIVELRTCHRCGDTQRVSNGVRLKLEAHMGLYFRTKYEHLPNPHIFPLLPREKLELATSVEACDHCFALSSDRQLCLWPELGQSHLTIAARINAAEEAASAPREEAKPSKPLLPAFKDSDF